MKSFGSSSLRHLHQFNGISKDHFYLYLKECEWRFNNSNQKYQLFYLKQLVKTKISRLSSTALKVKLNSASSFSST